MIPGGATPTTESGKLVAFPVKVISKRTFCEVSRNAGVVL
jgi:hypothetical protein